MCYMKGGDCCHLTPNVILEVPQNQDLSCIVDLIEVIVDRWELNR